MKTFKEIRGESYMRGFGIGPLDTLKPMNSMGSSGQFFPNRRYATTMPALTATAKGPGLGTIKPSASMLTANKKKNKKRDKDVRRN